MHLILNKDKTQYNLLSLFLLFYTKTNAKLDVFKIHVLTFRDIAP